MAWSKWRLRLAIIGVALFLPGCIISKRIPSWPGGTNGQLELSLDEGLVIPATINGQSVRLRVESGYAGIILNPAAAERIALRRSMFRSEIRIGRVRVRGETGVAPVTIGPSTDERRILWFERDVAPGVDGIINIADLPYGQVTLHLGRPHPSDRPISFQTTPQSFWNLTYRHPVAGRELTVRFRLDLPRSLVTAAGGAVLAQTQNGGWRGEPASAVIGLGVERPVRPMAFASALSLNGLKVDRMLVRTSDFLGGYALPEDPHEGADPDEVVITGRADRDEGRLTALIGLDHLSGCSRLIYSRATRLMTLYCQPQ